MAGLIGRQPTNHTYADDDRSPDQYDFRFTDHYPGENPAHWPAESFWGHKRTDSIRFPIPGGLPDGFGLADRQYGGIGDLFLSKKHPLFYLGRKLVFCLLC